MQSKLLKFKLSCFSYSNYDTVYLAVGDKPVFQCELCPTTCGRKTDLRIHVQKLHTSDKPLKCKRCGKTFPDRLVYRKDRIYYVDYVEHIVL